MKKAIALALILMLTLGTLTGCGSSSSESTTAQTGGESTVAESSTATETTVAESSETETTASETAATEESTEEISESSAPNADEAEAVKIRIGALKGPTSMGLVKMMEDPNYEFTMEAAADALVAAVVGGQLDIALVPANVASVLYNRTEGGVSVIDINTLSVLYILECGDSIQSIADLEGKTLYLTGKGTTPDYALQYMLAANGLSTDDVTLEYKSEPTEVASLLAQDETAIGLLPQPFVTAACAQNEKLCVAIDLGAAWDEAKAGSIIPVSGRLVTGVTIVRNEFAEAHPELVTEFMAAHKESANYTNENPSEAAKTIVELGIVANETIAEKAIPACSISYIDGQEMKEALQGYLEALAGFDPQTVGGTLPKEDFYYMAQ